MDLVWDNEPTEWSEEDGVISIQVEGKTDFWRKTPEDGIRDSGHFHYDEITGDFSISVKVTGQFRTLYDQAGLMIRADSGTWLKAGIEYVDGLQYISGVITRDASDWSIMPILEPSPEVWFKVERGAGRIVMHYSLDGRLWHMYREGYLSELSRLQVGMMCCAPHGDGFPVKFEDFTITLLGGQRNDDDLLEDSK